MRKLYLTLLLFIGSVGVGWAQNYSHHYDFSKTSLGAWGRASLQDVSFTVDLQGGFNNGWGDEMKVQVMDFNIDGSNPQIFAFCPQVTIDQWNNDQELIPWQVTPATNDESGITSLKNQSWYPNVFSVLNLRAGEIVRVKTFDTQPVANRPLSERFVIEHSLNAKDNAPWDDKDEVKEVFTATQEFIMTADGNLDLKIAKMVKILSIDIISNYKNFHQHRAHVGETISVDIPNRKGSGDEDYTSYVPRDGWKYWSNGEQTAAVVGSQYNQTNIELREKWTSSNSWVGSDGHQLWNVFNVPDGTYHVELYAASHNNINSGNFNDGNNEIAYVYANGRTGQGAQYDVKTFFPVRHGPTINSNDGEPNVCGIDVTVIGGRLELGLGVAQDNMVNWHCIQIKSLTKKGDGGAGEYVQYEPVVLYYGDLTPGTVTTTKPQNGAGPWNIKVSGFTGKQYSDGYWEGGAIIVMLDQDMHVFTVPYKVQSTAKPNNAEFAAWNFWQNPLKIGRSDQPVYKSLLSHDIAEGTFHNLMFMNNKNSETGIADEPMFRYKYEMKGQNAYYNPETAGLIFLANPDNDNGFYGVLNENIVSEGEGFNAASHPGVADEDKRDDLYAMRYIGLNWGSSFIVPELEEGDEVWVYIDHFGEAAGQPAGTTTLGMKIWNATDALGKKIVDGEPIVFGGSTWGPYYFKSSGGSSNSYVGAMHFFARGEKLPGMEKGDMKFEITGRNQYCFAKVCYVRIVKHNPQNLISRTTELLHYNGGSSDIRGYEFLVTQNADGSYNTPPTGSFMLHDGARGAINQTYEILEASGTLSKGDLNFYNLSKNHITGAEADNSVDGVIGTYMAYGKDKNGNTYPIGRKYRYTAEAKPAFGSFLLRGLDWDRDGKYCIEYSDRVISVGFRQTMNYPFTWDFTDILNEQTGNSQDEYDDAFDRVRAEGVTQASANDGIMVDTTAVWVNTNDVISLQNNRVKNQNNRTLASGTQLFANNTYIEETAGLGWATINMDYGLNNSIQVTNNGVKIQTNNGYETRIFVPEIKQTGRLYVRGKKLNDGKGFKANAYKNREMGPNRFKTEPAAGTFAALTPILPAQEVETVFHYEANFSSLIEGQQFIEATKDYDTYLEAVVGGEATQMEERLGSDRTVENPTTLYEESAYEANITPSEKHTAYGGYTSNGEGIDPYDAYEVASDANAYLDDFSTIGLSLNDDDHSYNIAKYKDFAIFDKDVRLCTTVNGTSIANNVYTNFLYTVGKGQTAGRYLKLTLPQSEVGFKVTIVARSQSSRQLNIFKGDSWGDTPDFSMVEQNNLSAKCFNVDGTTSLVIGSDGNDDSGIEIYAIYVEENKVVDTTAPEDWAGYVDVTASSSSPTGVTLYLNDIIIEKMAYSTDIKELGDIGWASESRDHYIDHSLTEYFTNVPVKAYVTKETVTGKDDLVTGIVITPLGKDGASNVMELSEGNQSPEDGKDYIGTGCIMFNTQDLVANDDDVLDPRQRKADVYLFVPDIHDYMKDEFIKPEDGGNSSNFKGDACTNGCLLSDGETKSHDNAKQDKIFPMGSNQMVANLTGETVPYRTPKETYNNYVLSYRFLGGDNVQHPTAEEIATGKMTERFVRVGKGGATGKANTAYLRMLTASVQPKDWVGDANLDILFEGDEYSDPDGIEEIDLTNAQDESENGTYSYYTLSGQKVNKPNKPGIYVRNGKKVYIK